jgi:hypothetical protein
MTLDVARQLLLVKCQRLRSAAYEATAHTVADSGHATGIRRLRAALRRVP